MGVFSEHVDNTMLLGSEVNAKLSLAPKLPFKAPRYMADADVSSHTVQGQLFLTANI